MVDPEGGRDGAPQHIHIEKHGKKTNWLPWLLAALALLALLLLLSRCDGDDTTVAETNGIAPVAATADRDVVGVMPNADGSAALAGTAGLGGFLKGAEATPRTFVFERLNFDTGSSEIRPADVAEIDQVAATLKQYPTARIRVAGYADARGSSASNAALGKARADSIKASLVSKQVSAARIETVSGGETDPVDSNSTASGRFENRRTELIVTAR